MPDALSSGGIDGQHGGLLPARTVALLFSAGGGGGNGGFGGAGGSADGGTGGTDNS